MFKKILNTFSTKVFTAALNFCLFMLTARYMGAEGRGEISLLITNIAFIVLIANLIGGSALIYLASRAPLIQLLLPCYVWAVVAGIITTSVLIGLGQASQLVYGHLLALSVMSALAAVNLMVLLGKEQIRHYNLIQLLQTVVVFLGMMLVVMGFTPKPTLLHYINATYAGVGLSLVLSTVFVFRHLGPIDFKGFWPTCQTVAQTSVEASYSNIIQFLNYRLSYYFLNHYTDKKSIGIFSTGMMLSESIWMIAMSIALIQYTRIANSTDRSYNIDISFRLVKLSFATSTLAVVVLNILPNSLFTFVFGPAFAQVGLVTLCLSPGIVAIAVSMTFSHYFSGLGRYKVSNWGTSLVLLITVGGCLLLVPIWGIIGAGVATSIAYVAYFVFMGIAFAKDTGFRPKDLLPAKADFDFLVHEIKNFRKAS